MSLNISVTILITLMLVDEVDDDNDDSNYSDDEIMGATTTIDGDVDGGGDGDIIFVDAVLWEER